MLAGLAPGEAAPRPVPGPARCRGHARQNRLRNRPCWPGWRPARQHPARCRGHARQNRLRNRPCWPGWRPARQHPARCRVHAGQSQPRRSPRSGGGRKVRAAYVSPFAGKGRHIRCWTPVLSAAFWGWATGPTCELRVCRRVLLRQTRDEHGWRSGSLRDPDGPCPAWKGPMGPCWPRPPLASGRGARQTSAQETDPVQESTTRATARFRPCGR